MQRIIHKMCSNQFFNGKIALTSNGKTGCDLWEIGLQSLHMIRNQGTKLIQVFDTTMCVVTYGGKIHHSLNVLGIGGHVLWEALPFGRTHTRSATVNADHFYGTETRINEQ